jgi:D-amino-acid dehydrogenase
MASGKSILILGGGVIGLCTAYFAMQAGHRVTLVERGAPDHAGCSTGNAGMVVPSHFVPLAAPGMVGMGLRMMFHPESPFALRPRLDRDLLEWGWAFLRAANERHVERSAPLLRDLNLASRRLYMEFAEQRANDFGLAQNGLLMLCKTEHALEEETAMMHRAKALGLNAQRLSPEEAARLDPNIQMDIAGAVFFPHDCHLNPQLFLAGLTRDLTAGGARFYWQTEARGWRVHRGTIEALKTPHGDLTADEYMVAGGAWSPKLVRDLALKLPMQAGKGYSMTLESPRQLPSLCSILTEARVAVTPMGSRLRFAGTMEITGLDTSISPARVKGIVRSIPAYFPAFRPEDFRDLPVWSGLRPCSPDGLPYIGRFAPYANLSVATGHAMMGLSLGPITGKLVAEVLSDQPASFPLEMLRPDRYA